MNWSWKIGIFAGIGVYVHATFLLLIAWIVFTPLLRGQSLASAIASAMFTLALFVCVVLHEYGHALTARRYGIKTRDITLLPIGGVARLERMPDDPRQELWVALAGPAVNVVIAAALFVTNGILEGFEPLRSSVMEGTFLERLLQVNISLVLFNLIPAFPMDGGRVLRALLAMRLDYSRATQYAANIGQGLALLFGLVGFFTNPLLIFIALFVWIGASQENNVVQMKSTLGGIPVQRAMLTQFQTLAPADPLSRAVQLILAGSQQDFPVVDQGRVVGILLRNDLLVALSKRGENAPAGEAMRTDFEPIDSAEMLENAAQRLEHCGCHTLPVLHGGQLIGLLTMENMGEFLMIRSALKSAPMPSAR